MSNIVNTNAADRDAVLHDPGGTPEEGTVGSRGRSVAFRVLAVLTALWLLALSVFGLLELVLMWLPDETLVSILDDFTAEDLTHRTHFLSVGIVMWAAVLTAMVQLRKPARRVAALQLLVVIAVASTIVYALSGTLGEWLIEEVAMVLVPVLLLAGLHPRARNLISRPTFDHDMVRLAALAALPWGIYIIDHARLQLTSPAAGTHAELEHWATAALMAIVIVAGSLIGASDRDGWRLPAWIAAGGAVVLGVHSLAFPGLPSALATVWALLAVAWGGAYAIATVRRSRARRPTPVG